MRDEAQSYLVGRTSVENYFSKFLYIIQNEEVATVCTANTQA